MNRIQELEAEIQRIKKEEAESKKLNTNILLVSMCIEHTLRMKKLSA